VTGGEIVDVHDVESGVDPPRDTTVQEVEDRSTGRRRHSVPRPDGKRRLYEHDGQPLGGGAKNLVLGDVLRALVAAEEMLDAGPVSLVGRNAMLGAVEPDRSDRARVDHPPATRLAGCIENVQRATDVDVVELVRIG
jgi:hypothetical protein